MGAFKVGSQAAGRRCVYHGVVYHVCAGWR